MSKQQFYAELPAELYEADDLLERYGLWANRRGGGASCGSAEGMYRSPPNDDDRKPRQATLPPLEAARVQEALSSLPMMTLLVIQWLYVDPSCLGEKMRTHHIKPRHMRERHLEGVRLFWARWLTLRPITSSTIAIRSNVVENCST